MATHATLLPPAADDVERLDILAALHLVADCALRLGEGLWRGDPRGDDLRAHALDARHQISAHQLTKTSTVWPDGQFNGTHADIVQREPVQQIAELRADARIEAVLLPRLKRPALH